MYDYRKYTVWQKSHQLVLKTYHLTTGFPKSEQYNFDFSNQQNSFVYSDKYCRRLWQKRTKRIYSFFEHFFWFCDRT